MIWNDSDNNNSLNIGRVTNVADTNSLQNGKILNVKYNTILGPDGDEFDPCRNSELTVQHLLTFVEEVSHQELLYLRVNEKLIPGKFYRITDYITTTSQNGTSSAGHPFDVIVLALSNDKLSEEAWAMHSARDTSEYFAESKLEAWKIWYCLDNDTNRFAWACDDEQGKGVIYRMIDEFGNDCPYDFKNILMETEDRELKYTITYFDTLNGADIYRDGSLEGKSFNNIISTFHNNNNNKRRINNCILINGDEPCYDNTLINCSECVLRDVRNSKLDNCTQCDLYYADDIQLYNCHEINNENGIRNAIAYYTSKIVLEGNSFIFNGNILANRIYQSNQ
jgi:hypothetical protein